MFFAELQSYSGSDFKYFSSLSTEMVMSLHDLNILELDKKTTNKLTITINVHLHSLVCLCFTLSVKDSSACLKKNPNKPVILIF